MANTELFNSELIRVELTEDSLEVKLKSKTDSIRVYKDADFGKTKIWVVQKGELKIGIAFTDEDQPDLLNAKVNTINHRLSIPLKKNEGIESLDYWFRNLPYRRSKRIKDYLKNRKRNALV